MKPTISHTRPRRPTRNLDNRNYGPAPLGDSAPFVETPSRAPPAAPNPQPKRDTSGPSAEGPPRQGTLKGRSPDPPPPLSSPPQPGSRVMARQARFSATWHHAVVSEVRITNGRTHVSVVWDDDTTTHAIPMSRIRTTHEPVAISVPPAPSSVSPFAHLCQGARVMARQTRHSSWCPATISGRHVYKGRLTVTVEWEGTSEGPSTAGIPTSRAKLLQTEASRPPTPPAHPTRIHPPQEGQSRPGSSERVSTTVVQAPLHDPQPQPRRRSATKNTSRWVPLKWPSLQRQSGLLETPQEPPCIPTGASVFTRKNFKGGLVHVHPNQLLDEWEGRSIDTPKNGDAGRTAMGDLR